VRIALDTNLLIYAEGVAFLPEDSTKPDRVRALLDALPPEDVILPVQVLGELYRVLVGKAKWAPSDARAAILSWSDLYPPLDTTASIMLAAADLAVDHQISIWDAVVLAAAAEAECRLVLSEDMHEGFTWRGLTVVNPVAEKPHPLVAALAKASRRS
jgi:predicted nucleic acid-binding protein